MKKAFLIIFVLAACKQGELKRSSIMSATSVMSATNESNAIVQTCLDSLRKELAFEKLVVKFTEVKLEKSKYLSDTPNLKWANSKLKYEKIPDSLKKTIFELDRRKAHPYILKLDSLSYDYSDAYVKILCMPQRTQFEYRLKLSGNQWHINEVIGFDYEEGPGPNITQ